MKTEIDLVVVNYNTRDKLKRLLDTLHKDDNEIWKLYVADNGSSDGSREWLFKTPGYRLGPVFYNKNIGYARACNDGAAEGNAPIIGFLNADVWLTSEDVANIVQAFQEDPEIAILGPKQRDEKNMIRHGGIWIKGKKATHRGWNTLDSKDVMYRDKTTCTTVSGSAYFIRRSVWEELTDCSIYRELYPYATGAFLPTKMYFEETFCSRHATEHGHKVFYYGAVSIGHTWNASPASSDDLRKFFLESKNLYKIACEAHDIKHEV